jgi:hypothetical protein
MTNTPQTGPTLYQEPATLAEARAVLLGLAASEEARD